MKLLVLVIIVLCLYLIYRIAFSGQPDVKAGRDIPRKKDTDSPEPVVKNRYVLPASGQPRPTPATCLETDKQDEKAITFASGNEKPDAVIPVEKLDEVFGKTPGTEQEEDVDENDLDIPPDEDEEETSEPEDLEQESEDLRQTLGRDADLAGGLSIEEMTEAVKAIDNPTDENAGLLYKVEPTDMFEKLVSGDEGKAARIRAVIDRNIQSLNPAVEKESENIGDSDYKNFNMADYLS
jgi:hypothetical protein